MEPTAQGNASVLIGFQLVTFPKSKGSSLAGQLDEQMESNCDATCFRVIDMHPERKHLPYDFDQRGFVCLTLCHQFEIARGLPAI